MTDDYDPSTNICSRNFEWGWSLNPSLRRMKDYFILPGGLAGVTGYRSYGKGADTNNTEKVLVQLYKTLNFDTAQEAPQGNDWMYHIGEGRHVQL